MFQDALKKYKPVWRRVGRQLFAGGLRRPEPDTTSLAANPEMRTPRPSSVRQNTLVKSLCLFLITAAFLPAQPPRVDDIEFYGLHKLTDQKLLHTLHLQPGDPLPPSRATWKIS